MIAKNILADMKAPCMVIFRSKLSGAVLLLTLVWVLVDAKQRLFNDDENNNKQQQLSEVVGASLPVANAVLLQELTSLLNFYQENDKRDASAATNVLSAEQQAKQQGQLSRFFIGDNMLELKAIISNTTKNSTSSVAENDKTDALSKNENSKASKELTVLLLVTNAKNNQSAIERFNNQADVYGYQLNILQNTQVVLTKKSAQGQQKVILTMYENRKAQNKASQLAT